MVKYKGFEIEPVYYVSGRVHYKIVQTNHRFIFDGEWLKEKHNRLINFGNHEAELNFVREYKRK